MSEATDEQAIDRLRHGHAMLTNSAPEAPRWETLQRAPSPTNRRRKRLAILGATALVAGTLVGYFALGPVVTSPSELATQASTQSDLPGWFADAHAVVRVGSIASIGDADDAKGPVRVYEAATSEVLYLDERYASTMKPGETIEFVVPGDLDEARSDYTSDAAVTVVLSHRSDPVRGTLRSEWRLWGVFDDETRTLGGPAAGYDDVLQSVLPDASSDHLAAWAEEAAAVRNGDSPGEYADAWDRYRNQLLADRVGTWQNADPRVRSLNPAEMPAGLQAEVEGIPAIVEIPQQVAGDPAFGELSLSIRSDFGVVHQANMQVGTHHAMLWSRPGDTWQIMLVGSSDLDGAVIGTIPSGGARDGYALSFALTSAQLRLALSALEGGGEGETAPGDAALTSIESLTEPELQQRLVELADS